MESWKPLEVVGYDCQKKFLRLRRMASVENLKQRIDSQSSDLVRLPAGATGYCYSAAIGVIHVGFNRTFTPQVHQDCTRYEYCVSFNYRDIPNLEIQA